MSVWKLNGPKIAGFRSLICLVIEYLAIVGHRFGFPIQDYLMVKMTPRTQSSVTFKDHTLDGKIKITTLD